MKTNANFNLTHSLIDAVREVVAIEAKGAGAPKSAPKKKVATVMIAHGKGGGIKVIPKKDYDPKKHHLADEKDSKKDPKMDPVGKADADVDNDGDKDKSDKYIHNRRKAIAKTMAKKKAGIKLSGKSEVVDVRPKMNEAEEIDEVSKATLGSYIKKSVKDMRGHYYSGDDKKFSNRAKGLQKALDKRDKLSNVKVHATEDVKEIDETDKSAKIARLKKKISDMEASMADAKKRGLHDKHSAIGSYLFLYKRDLEKLQAKAK